MADYRENNPIGNNIKTNNLDESSPVLHKIIEELKNSSSMLYLIADCLTSPEENQNNNFFDSNNILNNLYGISVKNFNELEDVNYNLTIHTYDLLNSLLSEISKKVTDTNELLKTISETTIQTMPFFGIGFLNYLNTGLITLGNKVVERNKKY